MPRPTAAQLLLGSATVVFTTLAMLLLSGATSGTGIALIGTAALALGLLVAVTVPLRTRGRTGNAASGPLTVPVHPATGTGPDVQSTIPAARTAAPRVGEHSLRH
ncbi:hypothetical protein [Streptomyces sp. NPDC059783]|uniref:hypothetical protein n=1 Tax=Streptomyces sp. NPDC059783 TaxID=3346944 RepID=UPI0036499B05